MKTFFSSFATKYRVVNSFIYRRAAVKFFQTLGLGIFDAKESFHNDENRLDWENVIVYEKVLQFNYFVIIDKTARWKLCFCLPGFKQSTILLRTILHRPLGDLEINLMQQ